MILIVVGVLSPVHIRYLGSIKLILSDDPFPNHV